MLPNEVLVVVVIVRIVIDPSMKAHLLEIDERSRQDGQEKSRQEQSGQEQSGQEWTK